MPGLESHFFKRKQAAPTHRTLPPSRCPEVQTRTPQFVIHSCELSQRFKRRALVNHMTILLDSCMFLLKELLIRTTYTRRRFPFMMSTLLLHGEKQFSTSPNPSSQSTMASLHLPSRFVLVNAEEMWFSPEESILKTLYVASRSVAYFHRRREYMTGATPLINGDP